MVNNPELLQKKNIQLIEEYKKWKQETTGVMFTDY